MIRTELIIKRLEELEEALISPIPLSEEEWAIAADDDPTNMHRPYGWGPITMVKTPNDPPTLSVVMKYCPDIIDRQTQDLDDEELAAYLDIIHYQSCHEVMYFDLPPYERQVKVEEQLAQAAPGSMALLSQVQFTALDSQAC